jgi:apolipoprotein N-acyltransferase
VTDSHRRAAAPFLLATLASAALYAASFPPLGLAPLIFVALAPFFAACARVRPLAAAGLGLLWGAAACFGVASWLPGALADFFATDALHAWSGFGAIALGLAGIYYAAFGAWLSFAARRGSLPPLLVGCSFAACEWARASWLIPSPWALSAYSQAPGSALLQNADLTGPFGFSLLAGAVNAVAAGFFCAALRTRRPWLARGAVAALLVAMFAYGQARLSQVFAQGELKRVALVQAAIPREQRFHAQFRSANLIRHLELTREAAASQPDLILWPEFAAEFYLREATPQRLPLERLAHEIDADFLIGAPDYRFTDRGTAYANSAFVLEKGELTARYDKVHLTPFSESNPLRALVAIGTDLYTAGRDLRPLPTRAGRVGVMLCSEAMLPGHAAALARAGAELLANPTNDAWFRDEGAARQQLAAAALRAVENRRYVVRPAANGYTALIDAHGRVQRVAPFDEPAQLAGSVRLSRASTPYQAIGNAAALGAGGLALAWTFIPLVSTGRQRQENRACDPTSSPA